jgi:hypothetical protein
MAMLAAKFTLLGNSAALSSSRRLGDHHFTPFATRYAVLILGKFSNLFIFIFVRRTYAKASAVKTPTDRAQKGRDKLSSLEKKFAAHLQNVKQNPKPPKITEEDQQSPLPVQKRLSTIARSTAQVRIQFLLSL